MEVAILTDLLGTVGGMCQKQCYKHCTTNDREINVIMYMYMYTCSIHCTCPCVHIHVNVCMYIHVCVFQCTCTCKCTFQRFLCSPLYHYLCWYMYIHVHVHAYAVYTCTCTCILYTSCSNPVDVVHIRHILCQMGNDL